MSKKFYVYILASKRNGTLYTGLTSDLRKRIWEHKNNAAEGFTSKHNVKLLVHFEHFDDFENAASREKNIKAWKRNWKLELIEKNNKTWRDLFEDICK